METRRRRGAQRRRLGDGKGDTHQARQNQRATRARRARAQAATCPDEKHAPGFVEVAAAPVIGAEMGSVVEIDDAGVRLAVRLGARERLDLGQLVSAFRRDA